METESDSHQDVADPDQVASGTAGTGQENTSDAGVSGDRMVFLYTRQERIPDRLNKKIGTLEQRVALPEARGWSK